MYSRIVSHNQRNGGIRKTPSHRLLGNFFDATLVCVFGARSDRNKVFGATDIIGFRDYRIFCDLLDSVSVLPIPNALFYSSLIGFFDYLVLEPGW